MTVTLRVGIGLIVPVISQKKNNSEGQSTLRSIEFQ